ncbi:hypothetical protein L210DRAFT_3507138 [Boletus edulis BED1]|uniref:Uncharacterized protein n=1 Tax=Boletus edulis BED1 TaxID=1328754 RepID=A0AAD4BKM0_BOLED|nr:hypothetical protein L210DRAFT_3507138 [Boletus edulis BED1]
MRDRATRIVVGSRLIQNNEGCAHGNWGWCVEFAIQFVVFTSNVGPDDMMVVGQRLSLHKDVVLSAFQKNQNTQKGPNLEGWMRTGSDHSIGRRFISSTPGRLVPWAGLSHTFRNEVLAICVWASGIECVIMEHVKEDVHPAILADSTAPPGCVWPAPSTILSSFHLVNSEMPIRDCVSPHPMPVVNKALHSVLRTSHTVIDCSAPANQRKIAGEAWIHPPIRVERVMQRKSL